MRPVTQRWLDTVRGSHRMVARARLVTPGQTGVSPTGTEIPILTGDVRFDATAQVRSTVDLTTVWPWPTANTDLFTPYGNELFVERGVVYGDGVREWVSMGYYRIDTIEQPDAPDGPVTIRGSDRMAGIVDARVLAPFQYSASTTVSAIFGALVGEVYPTVPIAFDFAASGTSFSSSHIIEDDRYEFLLDIAQSLGKVMYFAYDGTLVVETAPDPTIPVFDVNHGAGGVLVEMSRRLTRDGVYNAVVATGEQPGDTAPVRGVAFDLDTTSPTYWEGSFGKVPRFYSSSFLSTNTQCVAAAEAMLNRSKGLPYNVQFTAVPNPALEPLDAVAVTYSDKTRVEIHVIDTIDIPLTPGAAMTATTRAQNGGVS